MTRARDSRGKARATDDIIPDAKRLRMMLDDNTTLSASINDNVDGAANICDHPNNSHDDVEPAPPVNNDAIHDITETAQLDAAGDNTAADDVDDSDTTAYNPLYATLTFPNYIDDQLTQHRLRQLLSFADPTKNRYNIGLFPDNSNWVASPTAGHGTNAERLLGINTTPAVCWIIGSVHFMQTKSGRYVVGVQPLAAHDTARAKSLQYEKAHPSCSPATKSQLVYASKFLNNGTFDEAYDATDELLPWADMQVNKISYRHIKQTDIALLECLIRRYPPPNTPSNNAWGTFSIAFELAHIARVVVGPGIPDYLPD